MRRTIVRLLGVCVALYAGLIIVAYFAQRAVIYPAPAHPLEPRAAGAFLERIEGPDGTRVFALYAEAPPGAPTLVHFHGNGEDLAAQAGLVHALHESGIGVYAVEYPGYGLAGGEAPSEDAIYAAAEAALRHLQGAHHVPRGATVLEGQSLGTGVAAEMARRGFGARLVLLSPYTSMIAMASLVAPFLPVRWLLRDRYETDRKAPALDLPALVVHGTSDEVIPFSMGQRIAALLPRSELVRIDGGHHADLFAIDETLVAKIAAFARGEAAGSR